MPVWGIREGSLANGYEGSQGNGSIMRFAPSYLLAKAEAKRADLDDAFARQIMFEISDITHASKRVEQVCCRFADILDRHIEGIRTKEKSAYSTREEVNNSGWAVSTLEAALWAFNTTSSFEEGMIAAVNLGGDSDSIGAVYGQIAGAYYGFSAIPERWYKAVKMCEKVDKLIENFLGKCAG